MPSLRVWVALALLVLPVAGCAQPGGARPVAVWVQPTSAATTATPSPKVAVTPPTTTGPVGTGPAQNPRPAASAPPWCRQSDLRFEYRFGTGGSEQSWVGSVLLTNVSGPRCALTGYLTVRFRDASGAVLSVPETRRPDPQTPHTIAIPPGRTGVAGLDWRRPHNSPPPPGPCPAAATLEIWLPPTVENPHPELGPPARVPWVVTPTGGVLCGGTIELSPVNFIP